MPQPGWLNQNEQRAFPFVTPVPGVANECVLDAGFVFDDGSGFSHSSHWVYLQEVLRSGGNLRFRFFCNAPGLTGSFLEVTRDENAEAYSLHYLQSSSLTGESGCTRPRWEGFVMLGNCLPITSTLAVGTSITWLPAENRIEPALLRDVQRTRVRTINLANMARTTATAPAGCAALPGSSPAAWVVATCLVGDVVLGGGFNLVAGGDSSSVSLQVQAGGGDGPVCEELPMSPSETIQSGLTTLDKAWRCDDTLRSINGVEGPNIFIRGESGVEVTTDPLNAKITIAGNLSGLDICGSDTIVTIRTV